MLPFCCDSRKMLVFPSDLGLETAVWVKGRARAARPSTDISNKPEVETISDGMISKHRVAGSSSWRRPAEGP